MRLPVVLQDDEVPDVLSLGNDQNYLMLNMQVPVVFSVFIFYQAFLLYPFLTLLPIKLLLYTSQQK